MPNFLKNIKLVIPPDSLRPLSRPPGAQLSVITTTTTTAAAAAATTTTNNNNSTRINNSITIAIAATFYAEQISVSSRPKGPKQNET